MLPEENNEIVRSEIRRATPKAMPGAFFLCFFLFFQLLLVKINADYKDIYIGGKRDHYYCLIEIVNVAPDCELVKIRKLILLIMNK